MNKQIECYCGCGIKKPKYDKQNRITKYIFGHQRIGKFKYKNILIDCACGCKEKIWKYDKQCKIRRYVFGHVQIGRIGSNKGKSPSKETREKISIANSGERNGMYGKPSYMKGRKHSKESLNKLKKSIKMFFDNGGTPSRLGKFHTEETKQKIREKRKNQKTVYFSKPERKINSVLSVNGIKFEKHKPFKIGNIWHQVDIFIEPNIIIEVDGCYFHWCEECMVNKELKDKKVIDHVKRDKIINESLTSQGYKIIRIWEHDINSNILECLNVITDEINGK